MDKERRITTLPDDHRPKYARMMVGRMADVIGGENVRIESFTSPRFSSSRRGAVKTIFLNFYKLDMKGRIKAALATELAYLFPRRNEFKESRQLWQYLLDACEKE